MCRLAGMTSETTPSTSVTELIESAINILGSEAKLGKAIGRSQNAVWQAKRRGNVTAEMAIAIDRATNGVVAKERLRPDLFAASKPTREDRPAA
jgi:DNA-binding transcriptional regulator YdaS (Cro superfamily)